MLDLSFECALLSFDSVRSIIRLCSTYTSTVLDLSFECALLSFDRVRSIIRLCSTFTSTVLDLSFACARPIFQLCSTYQCEKKLIKLRRAQCEKKLRKAPLLSTIFRLCSETKFRPCSIYNSIYTKLFAPHWIHFDGLSVNEN